MATHTIEPTRATVHGYFSRELAPVLTVESGDSVILKTLNAGWHRDPDPRSGHWSHEEHVAWYDSTTDRGHALCGPIFIRGAEPGKTLEVSIEEIVTGSWGWSLGGGWNSETNRELGIAAGETHATFWQLDTTSGMATSREGIQLPMSPFCGVMGMPPDEPGQHSTAPPRNSGGNIDCKELVAGTMLYLPIPVEGGLFSAGDGHGMQGDGEVSGVAIECPMDRVAFRLSVREDMAISRPRAWTPDAWITFGFDADLDKATIQAIDGMLGLMHELHGLDRREAIDLASLVVDVRITQIVNGVKGAHAVLRHGLLSGTES